MGFFLALTLGIAGEVWVATQGLAPSPGADASACSADAFAAALHAQRPGIVVHAWRPQDGEKPPDGAVEAQLARRDGLVTLDVRGPGIALSRSLAATDPCERSVATSALIVDGALDELRAPTSAPAVDSLARPVPFFEQLHVSLGLGAGVQQGTFGFVPAFALGGAVRYRSFELTLDVDLGLPSETTFTVLPPEATRTGTFSTVTGSTELGVGLTPRLGPGRLAADVAFGLSVTWASASSSGLFQQQAQSAAEPFGALRLGYALDLPGGLFVGVRAEQRFSRSASFVVDGAELAPPFGLGPVTTPRWSFRTLGLVGFHFS
jgi:hypothetical protein